MKKLLLILICFFVSSESFSESNWIPYVESDYEESTLYLNRDSLRRVDNSVFIEEKFVSKKSKTKFSCIIQYKEIDCKSRMSRSLNSKFYSDTECSDLSGEILKPEDFRYFSSDSNQYVQIKTFCDLRDLKSK